MKQINVVGAVIRSNGKILCARRGEGGALPGLWEFPGGKIEPGETPLGALEREIREELLCEVRVLDEVTTTEHAYDFGVVRLITFHCELVAGTPQVTEHSEVRWLAPAGLSALEWAPADLPAVEILSASR